MNLPRFYVYAIRICLFLRIVWGQDKDPLKDFCRRFEHRTAVVNNKIYVDGGFVNWAADGRGVTVTADLSVNHTNTWLLYGDLLSDHEGFPEFFETSTKRSPNLAGGTLWADSVNNKFYAFGGFFPSDTPVPFETWAYDDNNDAWNIENTTGDSISYVAHGMAAVAPDAGIAYYLGGYQDRQTGSQWPAARQYMSQLITFNMITKEYGNHTGPDDMGRGEGFMTFIPASFAGLLIYFGGVLQDNSSDNTKIAASPMEDIWIFDIDREVWYKQKATGEVPENRARFCSGAAWTDDRSSYNIYMYGGIDADFKTAGYDDLYVLTIPAFVWIKMWPRVTPYPSMAAHSLSCDVINGTQMILMGGYRPTTKDCDAPNFYGQHGVDLGQINEDGVIWAPFSHENPPYRVPPRVVDIIGGTAQGEANVTAPLETNRTYDDRFLFEKEYRVPSRFPTPVTPKPTASSSPPANQGGTVSGPPSRSVLIGAIIGSILGGICLGVAGFYLVKIVRSRRRRSRSAIESEEVTTKDVDATIAAEKMEDDGRPELVTTEPRLELTADNSRLELAAEPAELPGR